MRGITKRFPGIVANDDVTFDVAPGEVHALLGENGAGKTTLMNVLTGLYRPDEGEIEVAGRLVELHFTARRDPRRDRDGAPALPSRRDADGGRQPRNLHARRALPARRRREVVRQVELIAEALHMPIDPDARIWQLSVGEQQRVEIMKAVRNGSRVLILDEPTAVLTPQEAEGLFTTLRVMAAEGHSVIVITHKLHEVMAVADRVTVLRGGRAIATVPIGEATVEGLAAMMVGRDIELRGAPGAERARRRGPAAGRRSHRARRPRLRRAPRRLARGACGRGARRRRSRRKRPTGARGGDHRAPAAHRGRRHGRRPSPAWRRPARGDLGGRRPRPRGQAPHGCRAEPQHRLERRPQVVSTRRRHPRPFLCSGGSASVPSS